MAERTAPTDARPARLATALRDRVNQLALGIALAVAGLVAGLARVPLSGPFVAELSGWSAFQARRELTLQGFELPCDAACTTARARPRLVFHRPLPVAFTLELAGHQVAPPREPGTPDRPALRLGARTWPLDLGDEPGRWSLSLQNPERLRTIELVLPPGQKLALERLAVRPAASS
jgi:hypothetical protein